MWFLEYLRGHLWYNVFTSKLTKHFCDDYFYHKIGGYSVVCQISAYHKHQFIYIFVGIPRSVNDSRVLRWFRLYIYVQSYGLFNVDKVQEGVWSKGKP